MSKFKEIDEAIEYLKHESERSGFAAVVLKDSKAFQFTKEFLEDALYQCEVEDKDGILMVVANDVEELHENKQKELMN
jgi:hypothetical protein